ncbi:hypothetical protein D9M73_264660 [compost metagenome]
MVGAAQVGDRAGVQRHLGVEGVQSAPVDIGRGDAPVALGETLGDGLAQASGGAGDQNYGGAHCLCSLPA